MSSSAMPDPPPPPPEDEQQRTPALAIAAEPDAVARVSMLRALLKALRPHQWFKNLFVAAPLVFGKHLLNDPAGLWRNALAVALFCALSGAVYLLNDLVDVERDRLHPTKRHRP